MNLKEVSRAVGNMIARAVVSGVSSAKCQMLQVSLMAGETKDNVEHLEPYGFTSSPHAGAEAVAVFPDGDRSHGVVLVVADRRYRIKGLKAGEVAIYTDEEDSIVLKRGRLIEVTTKTLVVNAEEEVILNTPLLKCQGEVEDKKGSMSQIRSKYDLHNHPGDSGGTTGQPNQKMG